MKHASAARRWDRTEAGRAYMAARNATDAARSSKALYQLTRVRISQMEG